MDQATVADERNVWTIVLAAGSSARLGRAKQLLPFGRLTLLARAVANARSITGNRVVVVIGAQQLRMRSHLRRIDSKARIVFNKSWRTGMGSSLAAGIRALPASAQAALIVLCDQPHVTAAALRRLTGARRLARGAVVASRYANRHGVPAIFPRRAFARLGRLGGDRGARALFEDPGFELRVVAVDMPEAAADIDTPADAAAMRLSGARPSPMPRASRS